MSSPRLDIGVTGAGSEGVGTTEWDSEALSSQSDNEVDLSHFAPIIDTAVSFSGVQAISFSLLWIDTAPLHCVLCVFSPCPLLAPGGSGLGTRVHVAQCAAARVSSPGTPGRWTADRLVAGVT